MQFRRNFDFEKVKDRHRKRNRHSDVDIDIKKEISFSSKVKKNIFWKP
jgi:hypothetical protein